MRRKYRDLLTVTTEVIEQAEAVTRADRSFSHEPAKLGAFTSGFPNQPLNETAAVALLGELVEEAHALLGEGDIDSSLGGAAAVSHQRWHTHRRVDVNSSFAEKGTLRAIE